MDLAGIPGRLRELIVFLVERSRSWAGTNDVAALYERLGWAERMAHRHRPTFVSNRTGKVDRWSAVPEVGAIRPVPRQADTEARVATAAG